MGEEEEEEEEEKKKGREEERKIKGMDSSKIWYGSLDFLYGTQGN